jgi:hypothetical protein
VNQVRQLFEKPRLLSLPMIDRVESFGQVDEDGCTAMSFIDGGYDIV